MTTIYFNIYLLDNTCIDLRRSRTREDSRLSAECWCWGFWLIASPLARGFIIHHLPHSVTRSFQKTLIACYVPRGTVTPSVRESSAPCTQSSAADNNKERRVRAAPRNYNIRNSKNRARLTSQTHYRV